MLDWIHSHTQLPADGWILLLALFGAFCIGLSKSGLAGTATLNVVIMAKIFDAKPSVGIVLPMLIVADLMGYLINRQGGSWKQIVPMIPAAVAGVLIGWVLLDQVDNGTARIVIGVLILALLAFNVVLHHRREQLLALTRHRTHLGHGWRRRCLDHARERRRPGDDGLPPRPAAGEKGAPRGLLPFLPVHQSLQTAVQRQSRVGHRTDAHDQPRPAPGSRRGNHPRLADPEAHPARRLRIRPRLADGLCGGLAHLRLTA
ncbi:MAG: sulfite exporter TauE/SafE family protein [Verrucomicrobia bacterium]|nr:sulfite exporter TauE/SafE family protein [Verrucomicrobiota bacterium]